MRQNKKPKKKPLEFLRIFDFVLVPLIQKLGVRGIGKVAKNYGSITIPRVLF